MIKKRLLAVQGPLQFVAGYIAMDWYGKSADANTDYQSVLLLYDFLLPEELEAEFAAVITRLADVANWHKIVFIGATRMRAITNGRYDAALATLREELGELAFDELYLARDFCGDGSMLIGNAYPDAHKHAYGDSFGLVADRAQFADFNPQAPLRSILSACKKRARRALLGGPRRFAFERAVLSLPLDLSRGELDGVTLTVPSKAHVQGTVQAIAERLGELRGYCAALLAGAGGARCHLFLLSNLSASGLMSQDSEIALYVDIIGRVAAPGEVVYLKVHPRSTRRVLDAVVAAIAGSYQTSIIDNPALARLPIELWTDLIAGCNVVAMFSTGAINIKYIHDVPVLLPLDDALIERYVYPEKVDYIKGIHGMIGQAMTALARWDGRSVLWRKNQ